MSASPQPAGQAGQPLAPAGATAIHPAGRRLTKCRVCMVSIKAADGDDVANGLCSNCKDTPEAALLPSLVAAAGEVAAPRAQPAARNPFAQLVATSANDEVSTRRDGAQWPFGAAPVGRPFSEADKAMIRRVGALMPAAQLLEILNERLVADLGGKVPLYSIEQLKAAIAEHHGEDAAGPAMPDWPTLRKLIAQARRAGVLAKINEQVINDFAVVFQLNAKQTLELKDVLLSAIDAE